MNLTQILTAAEDRLFPALRLTSHERALYYHLLRHSRLVGRRAVTRSKQQLADALDLAPTTIRNALRSLHRAGCIRIAARLGIHGLSLEVRLPEEALASAAFALPSELPLRPSASSAPLRQPSESPNPLTFSRFDSSTSVHSAPSTSQPLNLSTCLPPKRGRGRSTGRFRSKSLRAACFNREQARCFYCLRALREGAWSLDHVVPAAAGGDDSPNNAVAACHECNCRKGEMNAADFLRSLYRRGLLTAGELESRLAALRALCAPAH